MSADDVTVLPAITTEPGTVEPAWPEGVVPQVGETHCATLFFVGDLVYKRKKAVDLGFLDFTTRAARERACRREVVLNRRLAPDVYLGVADLVDADAVAIDHFVVMRRMPAARRLASLLATGADVDVCLRAIARQLATLHASAPTSLDDGAIAAVATRDAVAANWEDNLATLRGFVGDIVDADEYERVARLARDYLRGRRPLFDERLAKGQVRDGHGDLLAEDIFCLGDGPRIMDCLEFDDRYRFGDVLLDATFLAMDLERLGHGVAAQTYLRWYAEFSGEHHPASLAHHYLAYRAHVRAKVACLRHAQGGPGAAADARHLHTMVLEHLRAARVGIVLVGGLPGVGKSTVARALADERGWALLRTDELRKDLAGLAHETAAGAAPDAGLYAPDRVDAVYDELLARARTLVEQGVSVVLDASWSSRRHRLAAARVAADTATPVVAVHCELDVEVARQRLLGRPPGTDASDATADVLAAMARRFDAWPDAITLATDGDPDDVAARGLAVVAAAFEATEVGDG